MSVSSIANGPNWMFARATGNSAVSAAGGAAAPAGRAAAKAPGQPFASEARAEKTADIGANSAHQPLSTDTTRILLGVQESGAAGADLLPSTINADSGNVDAYLDAQYSDTPASDGDSLVSRFVIASPDTLGAMANHASDRFKQMMADYDIPEAPDSISYDREGALKLPEGYAYAEELMEALEETQGLARELRDLNAIGSHYVELQKRMSFVDELRNATAPTEADRAIGEHGYRIESDEPYAEMSLGFSKSGDLELRADGVPVLAG